MHIIYTFTALYILAKESKIFTEHIKKMCKVIKTILAKATMVINKISIHTITLTGNDKIRKKHTVHSK